MAKYSKKCADCEKIFELEISYSDYDNYNFICPVCNSKRIISIIKPSSIIFKGNGFTKSAKDKSREDRPFDG